MNPVKLAVELVGGPMCGVQDAVAIAAGQDVFLFRQMRGAAVTAVHAYEWSNRGTGDGRRWVLSYLHSVGNLGHGSGGKEGAA